MRTSVVLSCLLALAAPSAASAATKTVKLKIPQPGEVSVVAWAADPGKGGKAPRLAVRNAAAVPSGVTVVGGVGKHRKMRGKYAAFAAVVNRGAGAARASQLDALILIGAHRARRGELINAAHVVRTTATGFRALANACKSNNLFHYAYKYASSKALAGKVFLPSKTIAAAAAGESCDRIYPEQSQFRQAIGAGGAGPAPDPGPSPAPEPATSCTGKLTGTPFSSKSVTVSFTCNKQANGFKLNFGDPAPEREPTARVATRATRIVAYDMAAFACTIQVMALLCSGPVGPGAEVTGRIDFDDIYADTFYAWLWYVDMHMRLMFGGAPE